MGKVLTRSSLFAAAIALLITSSLSGQVGRREREYRYPFELVWEAANAVLQEQGNSVVQSDVANGIISTENRWQDDEELRYKYHLRVIRTDAARTTVSASSSVEGEGAFGLSWSAEKSDSSREALVLEGIAQRLDPASSAPNIPSPLCMQSFRVGGSIVRRTSYSATEDFAGTTIEAARTALRSTIDKEGLSVDPSADATDTIVALGTIGRRENEKATFTLTDGSGMIRLSVNHRLSVATRGRDGEVREQLCRVFGGVGRLTRKPLRAGAIGASPTGATAPIEERLRKLEDLFKKGLITEEEYKARRRELLREL